MLHDISGYRLTESAHVSVIKRLKLPLKVTLVALFLLFMSCVSHLQELPIFPNCKILKVDFPMEGAPDQTYYWTVWANTACDSLEVITYIQQNIGMDFALLKQLGEFEHDVHPMSWITRNWETDGVGKFRIQIRTWNRYTEDVQIKWLKIEEKSIPALRYKFF